MVTFRLSEEEYANLRSLCETGGARSVSDLARDAVSRLMQPDSDVEVAAALCVVAGRVDTLDLKVQRLTTASEQDTPRTARQSPERQSNEKI